MSNEFFTTASTGQNLYVQLYDEDADIWRTDTHVFETPDGTHWSHYYFTMTEVGGSGTYEADFPSQITTAGAYPYIVRVRAGAIPATTDALYATGEVDWDGAGLVDPTAPTGEDESLTTLAYVKIANGWGAVTTYDSKVNQYLPAITEGINKYLKRRVCAGNRTEVRNGQGQDWIRVWCPPINSIDQITVDFQTLNPTIVEGSNFIYESDTGIVKSNPASAVRYGFNEGFQNAKIEYNGGFISVPKPIQLAAAIIIRKLVELTDDDRLVTEKVEGERKIKWDQAYGAAASGDFGDPIFTEARALLLPYRLLRYI